jgi:hypothetical protein
MHKFITFCLLFCLATITAHAQSGNFNVQMLYQWDDDQLPVASPGNLNLQYSSCWGMAVNGHEYAVLGGAGHILIFDITTELVPARQVPTPQQYDLARIQIVQEPPLRRNRWRAGGLDHLRFFERTRYHCTDLLQHRIF